MRLESFRNVQTGATTVRGTEFSVEDQADGKVKLTGAVTLEEPVGVPAIADLDARSPRSQPFRKRR
jgi:hypothetical protein